MITRRYYEKHSPLCRRRQVIAAILHLVHAYLTDRYRRWQWVAWVSGIVLLGALWVTGVVGYWMVWDQRAQMIADLTARFLDYLPIFGESLSMSFSRNNLITNFFFFVALFVHLMVPVLLFIALWIHVVRISKPIINPPKIIATIIVFIIITVAVIKPATSLLPANANKIISKIGIDWFYLFFYPMFNALPTWLSWVIVTGSTLFLTIAPWLIRSRKYAPVAAYASAPATLIWQTATCLADGKRMAHHLYMKNLY